jgi:hypothetical protein
MDTINAKKIAHKAYKANRGNVTDACAAADIARQTWYLWYHNDEDFKNEVDNVKEALVDWYESRLQALAQGAEYEALDVNGDIRTLRDKPNPTAVIFALKTLGKHRGYIEKQEIDTTIQPVQINVGITSTDSDDHQDS